ncbi:MAG: hypothetical protein QXQ76_01895 [Candidatus Bathyarchaeia archaeon]
MEEEVRRRALSDIEERAKGLSEKLRDIRRRDGWVHTGKMGKGG